jgi:hypothetical protein
LYFLFPPEPYFVFCSLNAEVVYFSFSYYWLLKVMCLGRSSLQMWCCKIYAEIKSVFLLGYNYCRCTDLFDIKKKVSISNMILVRKIKRIIHVCHLICLVTYNIYLVVYYYYLIYSVFSNLVIFVPLTHFSIVTVVGKWIMLHGSTSEEFWHEWAIQIR